MHFNLCMVEHFMSKFPTRNNHDFILWEKSATSGTKLMLVVIGYLIVNRVTSQFTEENPTCVYLQLLLISFAFKIHAVKIIFRSIYTVFYRKISRFSLCAVRSVQTYAKSLPTAVYIVLINKPVINSCPFELN